MLLLFYLICFVCLAFQYSSSDYIQCTTQCTQITVAFDDSLAIPRECADTNGVTRAFDSALVCIIDYRIDYDAERIYVNFKASNDTTYLDGLKQSQSLVQTLWLGFSEESQQPNITHRKYECKTGDDCARAFYLSTIERLTTSGKVQLDHIHSKLYNRSLSMSRLSRRRCTDSSKMGNRTSVRCGTGLCYAHHLNYEANERDHVKKQHCSSDLTPTLFSEIQHHLPESDVIERELIEYRCNKNVCNRIEMIEEIKRILYEYTSWNVAKSVETAIITTKSSTGRQTSVSLGLLLLSFIGHRFLF